MGHSTSPPFSDPPKGNGLERKKARVTLARQTCTGKQIGTTREEKPGKSKRTDRAPKAKVRTFGMAGYRKESLSKGYINLYLQTGPSRLRVRWWKV